MRTLFALLIFIFSALSLSGQRPSIYSFQVDSIAGQRPIKFSDFKGKTILIVNTASNDSSFRQYEELKQLYALYKDSLAIVVFPTNSFSTEKEGNAIIASIYDQTSTQKFAVAQKVNVTAPGIHPLYLWLTSSALNGVMDSHVGKPFFKYLINKKGEFVGVFGPRINPMNPILIKSIESN